MATISSKEAFGFEIDPERQAAADTAAADTAAADAAAADTAAADAAAADAAAAETTAETAAAAAAETAADADANKGVDLWVSAFPGKTPEQVLSEIDELRTPKTAQPTFANDLIAAANTLFPDYGENAFVVAGIVNKKTSEPYEVDALSQIVENPALAQYYDEILAESKSKYEGLEGVEKAKYIGEVQKRASIIDAVKQKIESAVPNKDKLDAKHKELRAAADEYSGKVDLSKVKVGDLTIPVKNANVYKAILSKAIVDNGSADQSSIDAALKAVRDRIIVDSVQSGDYAKEVANQVIAKQKEEEIFSRSGLPGIYQTTKDPEIQKVRAQIFDKYFND